MQAAGLSMKPRLKPNSPRIRIKIKGGVLGNGSLRGGEPMKDFVRKNTCRKCCPLLSSKPSLTKRTKIIQNFLSLEAPMGLA